VTQLKLTYFDFDGGRGEPARIALSSAGIAFEDDRVAFADWLARKKDARFGGLPLLEVDGQVLTQSNTINRYVGRLTGLYPEDPWQAALCDEACDAVEEYHGEISRSFGIKDPEELRRVREELVASKFPLYLKAFDAMLRERGGEWFADGRLTIADLKMKEVVRQLRSGKLDHVPTDIVKTYAPKLDAHYDRVLAHPKVVAYYAARAR